VTIEDRVARLEQRIDQLDHIEQRLENVEAAVVGLRSDFNTYRGENGAVLGRILATLETMQDRLDNHDRTLREIAATLPRLGFRWPWEARP
jgi:ABC-type transporter Mla subunit MlaD